MFVRDQITFLRQCRDFAQELGCDLVDVEPVAVLGKHGVIPDLFVDGDPDNQRISRLYCNCSISNRSLRIE